MLFMVHPEKIHMFADDSILLNLLHYEEKHYHFQISEQRKMAVRKIGERLVEVHYVTTSEVQ